MEATTVHRVSASALGRRERREERAARRLRDLEHIVGRGRRHRSIRSMVVCAALSASAFSVTASPTSVVALGSSISGPAALTTGPQQAVRLDAVAPRGPVVSSEVQAILASVNAERAARGIAPVSYHEQLSQAAAAHAADQFHRDCLTQLDHTGTDGSDTGVRIARTGLGVRTWAENIACGHRTPAEVMAAWMKSDGHRRNILNPSLTHIGISVSPDSDGRLYWVQVFGTPR